MPRAPGARGAVYPPMPCHGACKNATTVASGGIPPRSEISQRMGCGRVRRFHQSATLVSITDRGDEEVLPAPTSRVAAIMAERLQCAET